jgi:hypothetical protein
MGVREKHMVGGDGLGNDGGEDDVETPSPEWRGRST